MDSVVLPHAYSHHRQQRGEREKEKLLVCIKGRKERLVESLGTCLTTFFHFARVDDVFSFIVVNYKQKPTSLSSVSFGLLLLL